jgi:hypothetical protein
MTTPSAPTSPLAQRPAESALGVDEGIAQAFRSAAHAFQVQAAALSRAGRLVAFASPGGALTLEDAAQAVGASTEVASRGSITRFFSPSGSETDYVLYATPVQGELALLAFFTMETPLGNARRTGQAIAQAMVRAGLREPPAGEPEPPPPELPRDWVPEEPSPEVARAILGESPPAPETPVVVPRDWIPSEPASGARFPFLTPPTSAPPEPLPAAPARQVIVVSAPAAAGPPLVFSLVLLPRFPEHRLTGALVHRLRRWVHRLCLAWDWTPATIDLRPDRLAVTLSIGADVAPAQALHQLRDGLAARILQDFPELGADLPSGRFWATPFLLVSGPLPAESDVAEFLRDTRRAQGFAARP